MRPVAVAVDWLLFWQLLSASLWAGDFPLGDSSPTSQSETNLPVSSFSHNRKHWDHICKVLAHFWHIISLLNSDSVNVIFIIKCLLRASFKGPFAFFCLAWYLQATSSAQRAGGVDALLCFVTEGDAIFTEQMVKKIKLFLQNLMTFDPQLLTQCISKKLNLNQIWRFLGVEVECPVLAFRQLLVSLDISIFAKTWTSSVLSPDFLGWSILSTEVWPFSRKLRGSRFRDPITQTILRSPCYLI